MRRVRLGRLISRLCRLSMFLKIFRIQDYQRKVLAPIGQENEGEMEGLDMIFEGKSRKGLGFGSRKQVGGGYSLDRLSEKF